VELKAKVEWKTKSENFVAFKVVVNDSVDAHVDADDRQDGGLVAGPVSAAPHPTSSPDFSAPPILRCDSSPRASTRCTYIHMYFELVFSGPKKVF
jgi:hypothetical protein